MDQLTPTAATETFEYIVVGAGSAGCVLAYRLAEAGRSVLVLEAGGDDRGVDEIAIPAAFPNLFKTEHDWDYETVEQKHALGRRMYWPRGKVLGGSSSINAQLYVRGNALDYDTWRDRHGCSGWGYADLLPYFLRSEDNVRGASQYHGVGGPLRVEDGRFTHELCHAFVDAAVSYGIEPNEDFNGAWQEGAGLFQVTQRSGRRWSAADAYLRPAAEMSGVAVRTHALVTAVVLDGGRAVGVRWLAGGVEHEARAEAEVLLSGGAVNSPQLLMLSGIGPGQHLREHGLPVRADLPGVGANLQDHLAAPAIWITHGTTSLHDHENLASLVRWRMRHDGPLASTVAEACAFVRSAPDLPAPDLQFHVAAAAFAEHGLVEPPGPGFTMAPVLVSVASRGTVRLASADPTWRPQIDAGYLSADEDLEALVAGIGVARAIASQGALSRWLDHEWLPGQAATGPDELREAVRRHSQTLYHPVGTCAMGTGDDAVVDEQCRVRGVDGLRVVDASVMPTVPRGNTNAPTIAVAEKAADYILGRSPLGPRATASAPARPRGRPRPAPGRSAGRHGDRPAVG
jgi:choline dehydrogenase